MKKKIEASLFNTISDFKQWHNVLKLIVTTTGASKGIISLRDRLTAELVIPKDIRQELSSPLVYGFSKQEVSSYISHYIEHDPWTEIENQYHPNEPYALSKHFNIKTLKKQIFWEWLEPQNISDTVILKIGNSTSKYWVAINLYYPHENKAVQKAIIKILTELQGFIQNIWAQGQKLRLSHFKSSYTEYFMEQKKQASFLINSNREVLLLNQKAKKILQDQKCLIFLSINNVLRVKNKKIEKQLQNIIKQFEEKKLAKHNTPKQKLTYEKVYIQIDLIGETESLLGENTALFILSIDKSTENNLIWENPILTRREKELVEILAKGGRVVDFQNHYNLAKSTAHMHWKHTKEKINIKDRAEIVANHQIYLQNQ